MSHSQCPTVKFNEQLSREADRVLADLIFVRAPIQTRLLKFLVNRAISGSGPITQYEIAVDGLGKPEDYLVDGDSYPRVQISRLRRNLENYYSRNLPENGFRITLEPGHYRLALEQVENEPATEAITVAQSDAREASSSRKSEILVRGGLVLGVLAGLGSLASYVGEDEPAVVSLAPEKPSTAVVFDTTNAQLGGLGSGGAIETARWLATVQMSNSFVSKPLPIGMSADRADYTLRFSFGSQQDGMTTLFLSMANRDGDVLYSNSIPYDSGRPSAYGREIESSLVSVTSPTGVIAEAELPDLELAASTDYACFLAIEGQLSQNERAAQLLDRCIERFPTSEYLSFWLARRSLMTYQDIVEIGQPVEKSGKAWRDLQAAFDADQFNVFANFVAAKVELAHGNCEDAQSYVNRALERGGSYPALIAAVETNAASCAFDPRTSQYVAERVRAFTEFNPNPDPLLRLYMIVGSLAAGDREQAEKVAQRTTLANPHGAIEETVDLLKRAFTDPSIATDNRTELERSIYTFVWNERATSAIMAALEDRPLRPVAALSDEVAQAHQAL
jgi:hypothetical protein